MPHVPDTDSFDEHVRLLAWREWLFGGVMEAAENVLRRIGRDELDDDLAA